MNKCNLKIVFSFVGLRDEYMTVSVTHQAQTSTITPDSDKIYYYEQDIILPTMIELTFSGKISGQDTEVDKNGHIVRDKHVLIKEILLDNMSVESLYLMRRLKLNYQDQHNYSNYIGFNGNMIIQFNKPDVFRQLMEFKRLGEY